MLVESVLLKLHGEMAERRAAVEKKVVAGNCKSLEDYKAECLRIGEMKVLEEKLAEAIGRLNTEANDENDLPEMKD